MSTTAGHFVTIAVHDAPTTYGPSGRWLGRFAVSRTYGPYTAAGAAQVARRAIMAEPPTSLHSRSVPLPPTFVPITLQDTRYPADDLPAGHCDFLTLGSGALASLTTDRVVLVSTAYSHTDTRHVYSRNLPADYSGAEW